MIRRTIAATTFPVALFTSAVTASAGLCDYRLSQLVGKGGAAAVVGGTAGTAAAGVGAKAAGFYLIVHSTCGAAMIGSTAAGASAAGTVGIIGRTAGAAGTAFGIITAPITIAVAAITAIGVTAVEGGCYFKDERITDYDQVRDIVLALVRSSEAAPRPDGTPPLFLHEHSPTNSDLVIHTPADGTRIFPVRKLYIVNGELRHRDWGPNTRLGSIVITESRSETPLSDTETEPENP